jgi:hypothetical protein
VGQDPHGAYGLWLLKAGVKNGIRHMDAPAGCILQNARLVLCLASAIVQNKAVCMLKKGLRLSNEMKIITWIYQFCMKRVHYSRLPMNLPP